MLKRSLRGRREKVSCFVYLIKSILTYWLFLANSSLQVQGKVHIHTCAYIHARTNLHELSNSKIVFQEKKKWNKRRHDIIKKTPPLRQQPSSPQQPPTTLPDRPWARCVPNPKPHCDLGQKMTATGAMVVMVVMIMKTIKFVMVMIDNDNDDDDGDGDDDDKW